MTAKSGVDIFEIGEPLSPAVMGDATSLSKEAGDKIKAFARPDPGRFLFQLAMAWVTIIGVIFVADYFQNIWVTVLAIFLIGTRQNILGLLLHEQCHRSAFRSKLGDYIANFMTAYPLLITLEGYRNVHLTHHREYFTDKDPDYLRKQGEEWTFPQPGRALLKTVLKDFIGLSTWKTIKSKQMDMPSPVKGKASAQRWPRLGYYLILIVLLVWTNTWGLFLLYWMLPLMTVLQVLVRWGAICEHKYNLVHPTVAESTPLIKLRWWESLLIPNLNFTLHVYHHYYPGIPFSKLPEVHEIFCQEGLVTERNVFHGYTGYLRYLMSRSRYGMVGKAAL